MPTDDEKRLLEYWHQGQIPVLMRKGPGHPLRVRLPGMQYKLLVRLQMTNWLRADRQRIPKWNHRFRCLDVPNSWLNSLVRQILRRFGKMYLIQPFREQEKCAPACFNAEGHECQCSCMGANHGQRGSDAGWFIISDTFATRWGDQYLACRLMVLADLE